MSFLQKQGERRHPHNVRTLRNTVPVIPHTVSIWLSMFSICIKDPFPLEHNKMNHRAAMACGNRCDNKPGPGSSLYWKRFPAVLGLTQVTGIKQRGKITLISLNWTLESLVSACMRERMWHNEEKNGGIHVGVFPVTYLLLGIIAQCNAWGHYLWTAGHMVALSLKQ